MQTTGMLRDVNVVVFGADISGITSVSERAILSGAYISTTLVNFLISVLEELFE